MDKINEKMNFRQKDSAFLIFDPESLHGPSGGVGDEEDYMRE
jgi:hypothetical protein